MILPIRKVVAHGPAREMPWGNMDHIDMHFPYACNK